MKKIMLIFGTRPEVIKMAPIAKALAAHPGFEPILCVTAQHREMLDQALELFGLKVNIDLDVMRPNQDLASLSARILQQLSPWLEQFKPDATLVQGDTTSTLFGALASFYKGIPVGHVEAGLRTGDMHSPFPEEMNRVLTTRLCRWHFTPTKHNRETLLNEQIEEGAVYITGNTVIDALQWMRKRIQSGEIDSATKELMDRFKRPYILITGHRRESFGPGFEAICSALGYLAEKYPAMDLVYPVHLNPNVQQPVNRLLSKFSNIHLIKPLGYEPFVALMNSATFILTDSGGVQEEAPSLGKPVLVMRDKTERIEGLAGGVLLVGTDRDKIIFESERLLNDPGHYQAMAEAGNPYGDGKAAERIVDILERTLANDPC